VKLPDAENPTISTRGWLDRAVLRRKRRARVIDHRDQLQVDAGELGTGREQARPAQRMTVNRRRRVQLSSIAVRRSRAQRRCMRVA